MKQKGEPQNGCYKKTKRVLQENKAHKIFGKKNIS